MGREREEKMGMGMKKETGNGSEKGKMMNRKWKEKSK